MRRFVVSVVLLMSLIRVPLAHAAAIADFAIPTGHWFPQANGAGGAIAAGYPVVDDFAARMWSEFQRLGGVPTLGYPVSSRFMMDGFTVQAFQKALLQWRPESDQVSFVNVFDQLHAAGKDNWLRSDRQIPPPLDTSADAGKSWAQVVAAHQALLAGNAALRAAYFADTDSLDHFGLPLTGPVDMGNVVVVRCQRAVLQQWKQDVPWAKAGQVTVANGGDIAKEAGILPVAATTPAYPTFKWPNTPGVPLRVDAWNIALRLSDAPTGYQYDSSLPAATALPNAEEPAGNGSTAVSGTRILGPFEAVITQGLVNGTIRDLVQANEPATATGVTLIENNVLVFDTVADARNSYGVFLARMTADGAVPESVGAIGDSATGAVARAKRSTDGAATTAYDILYRQSNVTGDVIVYYVGQPGSFGLATQLANATLAHLAAGGI